jgi:mono/diheme cytochrome c family protein
MIAMRRVVETALVVAVLAVLGGVGVFFYLLNTGLTAKPRPGAIETFLAQRLRNTVIGFHSRKLRNPLPVTPESLAEGRAHFADHCASCHGNDGSGDTEMGRGLYPKAPDMRRDGTQRLSDGQLFYIIENGVRLTGMPAWGTGTKDGEDASWRLVHFIRHLPQITPEEVAEMAALNPRSPEQIRQDIEAERFLQGGDASSSEETQKPRHEGGGHE